MENGDYWICLWNSADHPDVCFEGMEMMESCKKGNRRGVIITIAAAAACIILAGYVSDRMTHSTTAEAHKVVVQNQQEIRFLEAQIDQMRQELKICIEKGARK